MLELMSVGEVSREIKVSPEHLRTLVDRGDLPLAAMPGRGVRLFRREDVEALRDARAREAAKRAGGS